MSIIYNIGVNVHEDMRKEMMGKWIALLTCIINLKGNISAIWEKNTHDFYVGNIFLDLLIKLSSDISNVFFITVII